MTSNQNTVLVSNRLSSDISETQIREEMPEILDILLRNRSGCKKQGNQHIIWANDNYVALDSEKYAPTAPILPDLIPLEQRVGFLFLFYTVFITV